MLYDQDQVLEAISTALEEAGLAEGERAYNIAVHMTEWLEDLERLHNFCEAPEDLDSDEIVEMLQDFLGYVPEHLAAANKLLTGTKIRDIFEVGSVEADNFDNNLDLDEMDNM